MLKATFLLSESSSEIAQSILSPPVNLAGRASAAFIAICDLSHYNINHEARLFCYAVEVISVVNE